MTGSEMNPRVDEYLGKAKKWQEEMRKLRMIVLDCGLTEELKWYKPCYTFQGSIVAMIGPFKEYCVLSFFKGALLHDAKGILVRPGENSQSVRLIKFTSVQQIGEMETILKTYIHEAVEVEKVGLKVDLQKSTDLMIPEELQHKFDEIPALKTAFEALTPGRQRGYVLYFSQPKQSKTRESRIEKYAQPILDGRGLNDPPS